MKTNVDFVLTGGIDMGKGISMKQVMAHVKHKKSLGKHEEAKRLEELGKKLLKEGRISNE